MSYVCEHSVANPKTCDFRSGKVILQQEITREQMGKLLADGRTDLLPNFKSSRTGRNFKAFLVKQPDGKIGFEFEKEEGRCREEDGKIGDEGCRNRDGRRRGETGTGSQDRRPQDDGAQEP